MKNAAQELKHCIDGIVSMLDADLKKYFTDARHGSPLYRITPQQFEHVDLSLVTQSFDGRDDWAIINADEEHPSFLWPFSAAWCVITEEDEVCGRSFSIRKSHSIRPADVRGKVSIVTPYMVENNVMQLFADGRYYTTTYYMGYVGKMWRECLGGKVWHGDIQSTRITGRLDAEYEHKAVAVTQSIALRQRYEWGVSIRKQGGASFLFYTDRTGIKALFALRDAGEKGRRDALRTWITDHWRQNRIDPDALDYVRRHLRGHTKFCWCGYECEVVPAQYDIELNDRLRLERKKA